MPDEDTDVTTTTPAVNRRGVLATAAGGAVAATLLACKGTGTTADGGASQPADRPRGKRLAATSDIPEGGGRIFGSEKIVVTQPTAGDFKAFSSTCTHRGCQVDKVSDGRIKCPCHGSEYSIADGSVQAGPAPSALPGKRITVQDNEIRLLN
jgi:Rieske Fe-S protein